MSVYAKTANERIKQACVDLDAISKRALSALAEGHAKLDAEYILMAVGQVHSNLGDWGATVGDAIDRDDWSDDQ